MQDSRAFVRAPPGDGFLEPWAHAGRHHGDPRLARYCVRRNRPVINLSGPIRDESLTFDRVTAPEEMAEIGSAADMVARAATTLIPYHSPRLTAIALLPLPLWSCPVLVPLNKRFLVGHHSLGAECHITDGASNRRPCRRLPTSMP